MARTEHVERAACDDLRVRRLDRRECAERRRDGRGEGARGLRLGHRPGERIRQPGRVVRFHRAHEQSLDGGRVAGAKRDQALSPRHGVVCVARSLRRHRPAMRTTMRAGPSPQWRARRRMRPRDRGNLPPPRRGRRRIARHLGPRSPRAMPRRVPPLRRPLRGAPMPLLRRVPSGRAPQTSRRSPPSRALAWPGLPPRRRGPTRCSSPKRWSGASSRSARVTRSRRRMPLDRVPRPRGAGAPRLAAMPRVAVESCCSAIARTVARSPRPHATRYASTTSGRSSGVCEASSARTRARGRPSSGAPRSAVAKARSAATRSLPWVSLTRARMASSRSRAAAGACRRERVKPAPGNRWVQAQKALRGPRGERRIGQVLLRHVDQGARAGDPRPDARSPARSQSAPSVASARVSASTSGAGSRRCAACARNATRASVRVGSTAIAVANTLTARSVIESGPANRRPSSSSALARSDAFARSARQLESRGERFDQTAAREKIVESVSPLAVDLRVQLLVDRGGQRARQVVVRGGLAPASRVHPRGSVRLRRAKGRGMRAHGFVRRTCAPPREERREECRGNPLDRGVGVERTPQILELRVDVARALASLCSVEVRLGRVIRGDDSRVPTPRASRAARTTGHRPRRLATRARRRRSPRPPLRPERSALRCG